ncbi:hypothetical protein CEXT_152071 [Caerostris extrusa]|uniref:Uncharacterized protein n=1 Tax=Caerostris extrusa TaxID=172846 RepID=A0AAV4SNT9_CAEEX|nr:hypothetical protein CEXT_152071 [Caerostris extrusa]
MSINSFYPARAHNEQAAPMMNACPTNASLVRLMPRERERAIERKAARRDRGDGTVRNERERGVCEGKIELKKKNCKMKNPKT